MDQRLHLAACGVGIMASLVAYSILQVAHRHAVSPVVQRRARVVKCLFAAGANHDSIVREEPGAVHLVRPAGAVQSFDDNHTGCWRVKCKGFV